MQNSAHTLYDHITALRVTASVLYDKGIAKGLTPAEIQKSIQPLSEQMTFLVQQSAENDFPGTCMAIRSLETEAEYHEKDARFLIDKAQDARQHAVALRGAIRHLIEKNGREAHVEAGFSATLIEGKVMIR